MKKNQILILSIGALFVSGNMHPQSSFLQDFENIKSKVSGYIQNDIQDVKDDWNYVAEHIEKCLGFAKNAKVAETSIKQHAETSKKIKEEFHKKLTGPTTKKVNNYNSVAEKSKKKLEAHRRKAKHLAKTMHKHLEETVRLAKEGHKQIIAAHDEAQKVLAKEDKDEKENKKDAKK